MTKRLASMGPPAPRNHTPATDRDNKPLVGKLKFYFKNPIVQARDLIVLARMEKMPDFKIFTRLTGSWLAGLYNIMDPWKYEWASRPSPSGGGAP